MIHALLLVTMPNISRPGISKRCSLVRNITAAPHEDTRRWLQGKIPVSSGSYLVLHSIQSLETFVEESSTVIKKVLEKYADNMTYVFLKFDI